nr:hypothetical protein PAE2_1032 [Pseudomonas aeruginosa E2]
MPQVLLSSRPPGLNSSDHAEPAGAPALEAAGCHCPGAVPTASSHATRANRGEPRDRVAGARCDFALSTGVRLAPLSPSSRPAPHTGSPHQFQRTLSTKRFASTQTTSSRWVSCNPSWRIQ